METPLFCQSCAMPMTATEHFGTNKDLTANKEYCCFCYNEGDFTEEITMDEMIERCAEFMEEHYQNSQNPITKEEAVRQMQQYFPLLKRWKTIDCAYFASGCFWGTEYHFMKALGVKATAVGFMGGHLDNPTYEQVCTQTTGHLECTEVLFDPKQTDYESMIKLFFETHDFSQTDGQGPDIGPQYRSFIFYRNAEQKAMAERYIQIQKDMHLDVAKALEPASTNWKEEEYHQQYYEQKGR
ncbi:MAG: peptide-methionine (S)-S-oxide reductase MsrA, partial [Bacteroidales bacterium]|nr:peptide-methionine (S)-S-oxide reductase MsrA [Bacteroidales bacterium]